MVCTVHGIAESDTTKQLALTLFVKRGKGDHWLPLIEWEQNLLEVMDTKDLAHGMPHLGVSHYLPFLLFRDPYILSLQKPYSPPAPRHAHGVPPSCLCSYVPSFWTVLPSFIFLQPESCPPSCLQVLLLDSPKSSASLFPPLPTDRLPLTLSSDVIFIDDITEVTASIHLAVRHQG